MTQCRYFCDYQGELVHENSKLLEARLTQEGAKIALLRSFSYPKFSFIS